MTLPEYIEQTRTTDLVNTVKHAALGLLSEIGEVYGVLARIERGDPLNRAERMAAELGDVAWYLARLTDFAGPWVPDLNGCPPATSAAQPHTTYDALRGFLRESNRMLECPANGLLFGEAAQLWPLWARLCQIEGLDPTLVLSANLAKLRDRAARKVIRGDGDNR